MIYIKRIGIITVQAYLPYWYDRRIGTITIPSRFNYCCKVKKN